MALVATISAAPARGASDWRDPEAESVGRGGVDALERLDRSPGSVVAPGMVARCSSASLFAGSDLHCSSLRLRVARRRGAVAASFSQLHSSVHHDTALGLAAQAGGEALRAGAGLELCSETFAGYATSWRVTPSLGAGARIGDATRVAIGLERLPLRDGDDLPRLVLALETPLGPGVLLATQHERQPGRASRTLFGATWSRDPVRLRSGYDLRTQTSTVGLTIQSQHWALSWAGASHPELGWSEVWSCALQR